MASSDVDQKYLGRIAAATAETNPLVSKSLYQILGLSVILSRKLFRARKLRKLDTSRDTKSLELYFHIVWLSREGLSILEVCVLPYTQGGEQGPECQVLAAKLRASFYHIFCLFHNNPPITSASTQPGQTGGSLAPLSPRDDNGRRRTRSGSGGSQLERRDSTPKRSSRDSKGKKPLLRDPIDSITSDASFLTNPYAGLQPGTTPPPGLTPQLAGIAAPQLPPGLAPIPPKPSSFLLPAINFIPLTSAHFRAATNTAASILAGAHPLRLSVAIEHAAFLWDCVHDHNGARQLSRRAIRDLRQGEEEGVTDEGFEDAAEMVGILGRIMRRKSWEGTPGIGSQTSPPPTSTSAGPSSISAPSAPTSVPVNTAPPSAPPTAPIPTTPRRINILRDPENPPSLEGGPVGGTPSTPSDRRRDSKSSSSHGHKRSGSRNSTAQANTPRERTRYSGETPPRTRHSSGNTGVTPPRPPLKDVETPPRLPPKDPPRTTPSSTRIPSKQNTPSTRLPSKATTPASKPPSQKHASPLRERTTTTAVTTPTSRPSTRRRGDQRTSPLRLEQYHVDEPAVINGFYDDDGRTRERSR